MKTALLGTCLCVVATLTAAQNSDRAKPAGSSEGKPTLASTLKLIQDSVNDQGEIRYTMTSKNTASGETVEDQYVVETSNAAGDASSCTLEVDARMVLNGKPQLQGRPAIDFRSIDSVFVKSQSEAIEERTKQAGVQWTGKISPESYMIQAVSSGNLAGVLFFREKATANVAAKTIGRAVELCSGRAPAITVSPS
jgi:hypothetical protein